MKNFSLRTSVLICLMAGLTACSTFVPQRQAASVVVDSTANETVKTSPLDDALPGILAKQSDVAMVTPDQVKNSPELNQVVEVNNEVLEGVRAETADATIATSRARLRYSERDLQCLAANAYFEAGGEGERGMAAVSYVVLNRMKSGRYRDSICGVVYQKGQFSWTFDRRSNNPPNKALHERARKVARAVLEGTASNPVGRALSFHNNNCKPGWRRTMRYVTRVGNHFFYA